MPRTVPDYGDYELSANVSLLFTELPYVERFAAAAAAGFRAVETWWPFDRPRPDQAEVRELLQAVEKSSLQLRGLNFFAGNMPGGERGIACSPERQDELLSNRGVVREIAAVTGCRRFNLLYGQYSDGADQGRRDYQDRTAVAAYRAAADAVADLGGVVLLEPLAQGLNGNYPLVDHRQVIELLAGELAGVDGLGLLFDTFHLGMNGVDLLAAIADAGPWIRHVQIADVPHRSEPGSGDLSWKLIFNALRSAGYDDLVALEYRPRTTTAESLLAMRSMVASDPKD